jgi:hypothetical protein
MAAIGGHHRPHKGLTNDWLTPPEIVKALGPFDLDPCCPAVMPWKTAGRMIHWPDSDGMLERWSGSVWLNPPYGPQTGHWLKRLYQHGNGIALVFARTETAMFRDWVWRKADAVLFVEGRLHFHRPDGKRAEANSGAPSVLIAYGPECAERLKKCGIGGYFVAINCEGN